MDTNSRKSGARLAVVVAIVGAFIAYSIMTAFHSREGFPKALIWIGRDNYAVNMLVGKTGMLAAAWLFGRLAEYLILFRKWNAKLTGIVPGLFCLWAGTFLGCLLGLFQEGLVNVHPKDTPYFDYIYKPMFWVTFFGVIDVIFAGIRYGERMKKAHDSVIG